MNRVTEFENKIAEFFGAPYAVATDSCTHAIELCLRFTQSRGFVCPTHTYLSIPMLANKLGIGLKWKDKKWKDYYHIEPNIIDAAVLWERESYLKRTFMCLSFQYQKHLSLGRGGMILCDDKKAAEQLKKMSYDGRLHGIHWRDQNINTIGYHYYMTPETAALGLMKLPEAIKNQPRLWSWKDYPDLIKMEVFKW